MKKFATALLMSLVMAMPVTAKTPNKVEPATPPPVSTSCVPEPVAVLKLNRGKFVPVMQAQTPDGQWIAVWGQIGEVSNPEFILFRITGAGGQWCVLSEMSGVQFYNKSIEKLLQLDVRA